LAISKMVSEKVSLGNFKGAQKTFRLAFNTLFITGLIVSAVLFSQASEITAKFFADSRVLITFKICIPSIFVVSVASAFRGYFQGLQNMIPSALSQVSEQIIRVTLGFFISLKLLKYGIEWAAAGLAAGMLAGETVGLLVIMINYLKSRSKRLSNSDYGATETSRSILFNLFSLSLPITGGRLIASGLTALEAIIIPRQLQIAGYTASSATSLFGQLSGTALTLLTFPSVFTLALAISLIPAISEAMARKDLRLARLRSSDAVFFTMILGIPSVLLINCFADPLTTLFNSADVTGVLKILTLGGLFTYLQQTTTGILQGLGKTALPLVHSIISAGIRLPLLIYLTANPNWGLIGTAWAIVIGYIIMAVLNLNAIRRIIGFQFDFKSYLLQPLIAGLGMLTTIKLVHILLPNSLFISLFSTILSLGVYILILILIGNLKPQEIKKYLPQSPFRP
jgi:stage V sporulation protein B